MKDLTLKYALSQEQDALDHLEKAAMYESSSCLGHEVYARENLEWATTLWEMALSSLNSASSWEQMEG